jgi:hypothetical protein
MIKQNDAVLSEFKEIIFSTFAVLHTFKEGCVFHLALPAVPG